MRIDVKKILFYGTLRDRDAFFKRAQEFGIVQYLSVVKKEEEWSSEWLHLNEAKNILQSYAIKTKQAPSSHHRTADEIASDIIRQKETIDALTRQKEEIKKEWKKVVQWGAFSSKEVQKIEQESGYSFRFFIVKKKYQSHYRNWICIKKTGQNLFLVRIRKTPFEKNDQLKEVIIKKTKSELEAEWKEVEEKIGSANDKLYQLTEQLAFIKRAWIDQHNEHRLKKAQEAIFSFLQDKMFAVEGWVPQNCLPQLQQMVQSLAVHYKQLPIRPDDAIPTYLHNEGMAKIGQDLIQIYDTPSICDKDPSAWVLFSFTFFFGMIMGDGGYGLVLLAIALLLKKRFPQWKGAKKRFTKLVVLLSCSTIAWGAITSSFFSLAFSSTHPIKQYSPLTMIATTKAQYHLDRQDALWHKLLSRYPAAQTLSSGQEAVAFVQQGKSVIGDYLSDQILLELSLLIGLFHLLFAFFRNISQSPRGLGWACFLIGLYLYTPSILNATSLLHLFTFFTPEQYFFLGKILMMIGAGFALTLAMIKERMKGIIEITQIMSVFSDLLSYLRLYALAMSGAIMGSTFNEMGAKWGGVIGIVLVCLGHTLNFTLNIIGGVIHGLRLNFLEWYHHCFQGGGKQFAPLEKMRLE